MVCLTVTKLYTDCGEFLEKFTWDVKSDVVEGPDVRPRTLQRLGKGPGRNYTQAQVLPRVYSEKELCRWKQHR